MLITAPSPNPTLRSGSCSVLGYVSGRGKHGLHFVHHSATHSRPNTGLGWFVVYSCCRFFSCVLPPTTTTHTHTHTPLPLTAAVVHTATCRTDQYDRPIAGHANFGPNRISTSPLARASQVATAVHEISHALGWSVVRVRVTAIHNQPCTWMIGGLKKL